MHLFCEIKFFYLSIYIFPWNWKTNTTYQEQVSSRDLCQCNFSWYSKDWRKYWVCLESGFAWFLMRSFWNCSSHWSLIDPKMDLIQYYYFCCKKKHITNKINSLFISEKFREIAQHLPTYHLPITVLLFYWRIHSCAAFWSWFLLYDLLTENFVLIRYVLI